VDDIRAPTLHTAGLAAVERAANAALALSPHSGPALAQLAGRVVALECTDPALTVYLCSDEHGQLQLRGVHEGEVSTRVRGSARDFAELAGAEDPAATLINGGLSLEGSSGTLIDMQRVFSELDLDWEAPLVDALGDVPGHQLAQMLRGALSWTRQASGNLRRQLSEFALEEARLTPPRLALEDFYRDVGQLQEREERLTRQIASARRRLQRLREA
jgi:ubiquinone biosynthesis protein UbiJ